MSFKFPEYKDVKLKESLLREVVFQIKYPTILKISHEEPFQFQEKIRKRFPGYEKEISLKLNVGKSKLDEQIPFQLPVHRFYTNSKKQFISLAQDFCSFSALKYKDWNEFKSAIQLAADTVSQVYEPGYISRLGLRYINFIEPGKYKITIEDLINSIRMDVTSMYKTDVIPLPDSALHEIRISDGDDKLTIRHGIVPDEKTGNKNFLLDFDNYIQGEIQFKDLESIYEKYHKIIYNAFRWYLGDEAFKIINQ